MARILTALLVLSAVSFATANAERTLEDVMKEMNVSLKAITKTFKDESKKEDNIKASLHIRELLNESLNFTPSFVENLPADRKDAALIEYKRMIQMTMGLVEKLDAALAASDLTLINQTLNDLQELKDQGHDAFDP